MSAPVTAIEATAALTAAWEAVEARPEFQIQRFAAHRYTDAATVYVLMERGLQRFNGLAIGLEDGQLYIARGAAPKRAKGIAGMVGLLEPAKTLRRGKPLPDRHILNPTDAEWAVYAALMTGGTFELAEIAD